MALGWQPRPSAQLKQAQVVGTFRLISGNNPSWPNVSATLVILMVPVNITVYQPAATIATSLSAPTDSSVQGEEIVRKPVDLTRSRATEWSLTVGI